MKLKPIFVVMKGFLNVCLTGVSILLSVYASAQQDVMVTITGLRSNSGNVIIQVFDNQENFAAKKPVARYKYAKASMVNGVLTVKCPLKPGTNGLAMLDDENTSGKMDYNMVGMPKEGFGFSDYYHTGMSRPKFEDFKFEVAEPAKQVKMKVRYL